MSPRKRHLLAGLALLVLMALPCGAANLELAIDAATVVMNFAVSDFNLATGVATITRSNANRLTVKSTTGPWTLSIRGNSSTFAFTPSAGDSNPNKPCAHLRYKLSTSSTFVPLSTSSTVLASGAATTNRVLQADYQVTSSASTDRPGTYSLSIIYTLTQP